MARFYLPPEAWGPGELVLGPEESHHCAAVLRLGPGEEATLFDGRGTAATCEIVAASKRSVRLVPKETRATPPPACRIALAQALPKGKHFDSILQKATELGASAIHPLRTERTVAQPDADSAPRKLEKWRQVAVEAAKQCGQNWLPDISPPLGFREFLERAAEYDLRLIASLAPGARPLRDFLARPASGGAPPRSAVVAVGPEGDFSPGETGAALAAGFLPITLGPITLRVETAALCALSLLAYELVPAGPPAP